MQNEFEYWNDLVETLDQGGITKDPFVLQVCKQCHELGYTKPLENLLQRMPQLLRIAKRNIIEQKEYPFWPPPWKKREIDRIKGRFNIGTVNSVNDIAGLDPLQFTRGMFIAGEIGSGKSYPILRMINQMLSIPIEERGFNILIVQASKTDADFLIRPHRKLRIIEFEHLRRSLLQIEDWDTEENKTISFFEIFSSVNWLKGHSQPIFKRMIERGFEKHKRNPNFVELFKEIIPAAKEIETEGYDQKNVKDHIRSMISTFIQTKEVLNCHKGMTVQDFFSKEDIILNLKKTPKEYVLPTLIVDIFKDLQRYYERFPVYPPKLRTLIIVDECRDIFPSEIKNKQDNQDPNSPMINFVTSRRSSGIGMIAITQEPQSAPDWLTNNSAYVLCFPIGGKGRSYMQNLISLTDKESAFLEKLPEKGTGIMRYRGFDRKFLVEVPGDLEVKPISKEEVDEIMQPFIQQLHKDIQLSSTQTVDVDAININKAKKDAIDQLNALYLLEKLISNPFITYTQLRNMSGISSSDRMKSSYDWLIEQGFIEIIECVASSSGAKTKYPALTQKVARPHPVNPRHFKHTMYKNRIFDWLISQGHDAVLEYSANGESDDRIDVYSSGTETDAMRIGYEVTLTLNKTDIMKNVTKCLKAPFNVKELNIVCENTEDLEKAMQMIAQSNMAPSQYEKLTFKIIKEFS